MKRITTDSASRPVSRRLTSCLGILGLALCILCSSLYVINYYPITHPRYMGLALSRTRYTFLQSWRVPDQREPVQGELHSVQQVELSQLEFGEEVPLAKPFRPLDETSLGEAIDWLIREGYVTYTAHGPCGYVETKQRSIEEQFYSLELIDRGLKVACSDLPLGGNCFAESIVTFAYRAGDGTISVKRHQGEFVC